MDRVRNCRPGEQSGIFTFALTLVFNGWHQHPAAACFWVALLFGRSADPIRQAFERLISLVAHWGTVGFDIVHG